MNWSYFFKYRKSLGMTAWIFQRISGLALLFYLIIHLWVTSNLARGPQAFDKVMHFLSQPLFKFLEIGLLGAVLYHALNGIRLFLLDLGLSSGSQRFLFWFFMALGLAIFSLGAYPLFPWNGK